MFLSCIFMFVMCLKKQVRKEQEEQQAAEEIQRKAEAEATLNVINTKISKQIYQKFTTKTLKLFSML